MTKRLSLALALSAATFTGAYAQQTPAAPTAPAAPTVIMPTPAPGGPATTTPPTNAPVAGAPLAGANSFTEAQAKTRLETQGFTSVSALTKDKDGIWRGKATKAGNGLNVSVDYQGNIVEN